MEQACMCVCVCEGGEEEGRERRGGREMKEGSCQCCYTLL